MSFLSCLAQVVVMAAVTQMRQPQEEGETSKDKIVSTHTDKPSPRGCVLIPEQLSYIYSFYFCLPRKILLIYSGISK